MESDNEKCIVGYTSNTVKKARLQSTLSALLDDPILADVPKKSTLSDVETLINLELGSAMLISVLKMDGTTFDIAVLNSATVKDLKLAIKRKINEMEQSQMGHRHISWKGGRMVTLLIGTCVKVTHVCRDSVAQVPKQPFAEQFLRRHVWANFCLSYHNEKLIDDNILLQDFGIRTILRCILYRV